MDISLNSPERFQEIRSKIQGKRLLKLWYDQRYQNFMDYINANNNHSKAVIIELGAGASYLKDFCPNALYTDVINYPGLDRILDATSMDLENDSVDAFFMMNVLHHIPDPMKFFEEAHRVLKPGGKIFMTDHFIGPISYFLYRFIHNEPFNPTAEEWSFTSSGPLTDANTALSKIIFERDREIFEKTFPNFSIESMERHSPLTYWFSGGLKNWTLVPRFVAQSFLWFDSILVKLFPWAASFQDIKIKKN